MRKQNNNSGKYLKEISDLENKVAENEWYRLEYEKIIYSFSYRLLRKIIVISSKIGVYQFLKYLLDNYRKFRYTCSINLGKITEYKYYRFKKNRNSIYKFNPNEIKHNYKKGLVSIVLPIFNGKEYMKKTIDSILNQSYKNFELIIVNDGSTDDTLKIANNFAKKDKRIKIIDQQNKKLPVSISNGFSIAQGEYYMWVGADDVLHNNCVSSLVKELKSDEKIDFVYPNVRLIDEHDNPIVDNKWYNKNEKHPEYVILPTRMYNFNVVKDNYIAPIAMYKSIVVKTLGGFSKNRFTVEDYEYWMRINNIFNIKHTTFETPIFDYRRHNSSLTSQSKELNISKKTDDLMMFEDFRRDYLMTPMLWVIDYEDSFKEYYNILVKRINDAGHQIVEKSEAFRKEYSGLYKNQVYLYIGNESIDLSKNMSDDIFKVIISSSIIKNYDNFDLCITTDDKNIETIDQYRGWFSIKSIDNAFALIDIKTKHNYLSKIENYIENDESSEFELSVVICTYKRSNKLNNVIKSVINQKFDKSKYEIIVVNNDIKTKEIYEIVSDYRKKYDLSDNFLKYFEAPIKGLSYARNVGAFVAKGKRILYLDDDSIAFEDLIEQTIIAYEENDNAGVVGGQIILKLPKPTPKIIEKGKEAYWSQFIIDGDNYKEAKNWYDFPYGANFSVERKALLKIGGFRTGYGRVGHNFVGGEEIVVSSMIKKQNMSVILAPKSKVYHDVDESRYTEEHIRKTDLGNAYTRLKMELDLYIPIHYLVKRNSKFELKYLEKQLPMARTNKQKFYLQSNIDGHKAGLKELKVIAKELGKF